MTGPLNYFGNSVANKEEIETTIWETLSDLELYLNCKFTNDDYRNVTQAYFDNYDWKELEGSAGHLSFMHPQSYAILCAYDLKALQVNNEKAFKNGSAF